MWHVDVGNTVTSKLIELKNSKYLTGYLHDV